MRTIVEYAVLRNWRQYHTYRSDRSAAGFPDLILLRAQRAVALEVKAERGRVSDAQLDWLAALARAGIEAHLVRPRDWEFVLELLQ